MATHLVGPPSGRLFEEIWNGERFLHGGISSCRIDSVVKVRSDRRVGPDAARRPLSGSAGPAEAEREHLFRTQSALSKH